MNKHIDLHLAHIVTALVTAGLIEKADEALERIKPEGKPHLHYAEALQQPICRKIFSVNHDWKNFFQVISGTSL